MRQAAEIVKINDMISREEDPDKIKNYIVQTPFMDGGNKEQYINDLQSKQDASIAEGRRRAFQRVAEGITPKRGMLSHLLETPSETLAVANGQMAVDAWIKQQTKAGKIPSMAEIEQKGIEFGQLYQVPMSTKILEMNEAGKVQGASAKEAAAEIERMKKEEERKKKEEERKKKESSVPPVRMRIE